ncbi:MAG: hypothetical protein GWQ05_18620 [Verrucomicrobiaceae bacterium]|nr:hypothetical protein [Verrucomicrobiaceae bacterium]NCF92947.1 hypothetical protein [Verrucomicrobiaceae bacterium]
MLLSVVANAWINVQVWISASRRHDGTCRRARFRIEIPDPGAL